MSRLYTSMHFYVCIEATRSPKFGNGKGGMWFKRLFTFSRMTNMSDATT